MPANPALQLAGGNTPRMSGSASAGLPRVTAALTTASSRQSPAHTHDAVGVLLIGLPISSMAGSNVSAQVAQYKGGQLAIARAARMKSCYTASR